MPIIYDVPGTYHFVGAVAYDRLGSSWRTAAGLRSVSVIDPTTGLLPTGLTQDGLAVTWLTADKNSRYSFTCDVPGVVVDFGAGAEALYAAEVPRLATTEAQTVQAIADDAAASAAAAAASASLVGAPADTAVAAIVGNPASATRVSLDSTYKGALGVINVRDFGVLPTNTAAVNATNLTAARAALGTTSGTLHFPPGDYPMDPVDFSMFANVALTGVASMVGGIYSNGSGNAASRLLFSNVTTGYGIKVDGGFGFTMRDLAVVATNTTFSGRLLDMRQVAAATVTGLVTLERCFIAGNTTNRNGIGVDLDKTVSTRIKGCTVVDFQHSISGMGTAGSFSNVVTIEETFFQNNRTSHIHNPGQAWVLKGNTYEALSTGQAGAVLQDAGFIAEGITIEGGWLGDITSGTASTHFNFLGAIYGLDAHGAFIGGTTAATGFNFTQGYGIHIHGNSFHGLGTAVMAAVGVTGEVGPNAYMSMTGVNVTAPSMAVTDAAGVAWTPVWSSSGTAPAIGNGQILGTWRRGPGKMIDGEMSLSAGSTTTFGTGTYSISLPAVPKANQSLIGEAIAFNSGVASQVGVAVVSGANMHVTLHGAVGDWATTVPWTFKSGDYVKVRFRYEEA